MRGYVSLAPTPGLRLDNATYGLAAGDIDGDGRTELVVLGPEMPWLGLISYFEYGDLGAAWSGRGPSQLISPWFVVGTVPGGWELHASDTFSTADVDGDGVPEVVVYQPASGYLGVLAWQSSGLAVRWGAQLIPQLGMVSTSCSLTAADVDGDGMDELFVYDSTSKSVAVLKWQDGAMVAIWQIQGTIPGGLDIETYDRFFAARLNLGGPAECDAIVAFSAYDGYLVALGWDGDAKRIQICGQPTHLTIGGATTWTLSPDDHLIAGDADGDGWDEIFACDAAGANSAVIDWTGTEFTVVASAAPAQAASPDTVLVADLAGTGRKFAVLVSQGTTTLITLLGLADTQIQVEQTSLPNSQPGLSGSPIFTVGDVDGDGREEIVGLSAADQSVGVYAWAQHLLPTPTLSAAAAVPGFNPPLIAAAPPTAFTPFTPAQAEIYAQVGPSLLPPTGADVRGQYSNQNNENNFGAWASQLEQANAGAPGWTWLAGYQAADVKAVLPVLAQECGAVSTTYGFYNAMFQAMQVVKTQQDADLQHCIGVVEATTTPPATSPIFYWMAGIFDACLWGAAAVPGLNAFAIPLAMLASLGGTVFGAANSTPPTSVDYSGFSQQIDNNYVQSSVALSAQTQTVVDDPAKLALLGTLLQASWRVDLNSLPDLISHGSAASRIAFYQLILPITFQIAIYRDSDDDYPTQKFTEYFPLPVTSTESLGSPANAFIALPSAQTNGNYDVYLLYRGSNPSALIYPGTELTTDLFSTLGIAQSDLFCGGWNIPTTNGYDFHSGL